MTFSINPTAAKTQTMFQSMAIALNGTGAGSAITGGAAPAAAAPAAAAGSASNSTGSAGTAGAGTAAAGSGSTAGVTTGTGTLQNGQCQCAVTCTAGALPAAAVQGVGAFGGIPGKLSRNSNPSTPCTVADNLKGSIPMAMSEPAMNAALAA